MGIFPVWGFQMFIAIMVSIYFKLNKALVLIAANVSIPPMMPLILYSSHFMGKIWMGKEAKTLLFTKQLTLDFLYENFAGLFVQYVYGAITLAFTAGVTFGMLTYGLLKLLKRRK